MHNVRIVSSSKFDSTIQEWLDENNHVTSGENTEASEEDKEFITRASAESSEGDGISSDSDNNVDQNYGEVKQVVLM